MIRFCILTAIIKFFEVKKLFLDTVIICLYIFVICYVVCYMSLSVYYFDLL